MSMSNITLHLRSLIDGSEDATVSEHSKKNISQWLSLGKEAPSHRNYEISLADEEQDVHDHSVLDLYSSDVPEDGSAVISRLRQNPNHETLIPAVFALLSSNDINENISEQMAEFVGFENLDLAMEMLGKRDFFKEVMLRYLSQEQLGAAHDRVAPKFSGQKDIDPGDLSSEAARKRMEKQFQENAAKPLFSGVAHGPVEVLPHVYSSSALSQNNILSSTGQRYMLPLGTERRLHEEYEEVIVPPAKPVPPKSAERLIPVSQLDPLARGCFPGYTSLNRIQSIVYPTAYGTNENMLICAPTGAGKTDVAMLTILRVIEQHRSQAPPGVELRNTINRSAFKIIYVAPMKALASEIVRKLGKRLRWLSIEVRELTGDMQMTKGEIAQTQIIVTTPEKWDVVTRKPTGEGELASSLKLLIVDEVHLLNDERGAVIETIVARTLRQVESSQSIIRIVGLSATLPNFIDVAEFLSVSKYKGLFYFDSSFRPIPLEQHFLGIRGKPGSTQSRKNLDFVTFEKVSSLVAAGHQVMVFVHARKETVKAAMDLKETATVRGSIDDYSCQDHPQWALFRREIGQSRNKEMKLLFDYGFGIHHAGMLRQDRNLMEKLFEGRAIKVLCCTATLAWGVNLPAHAVIIKGTQVYDSSRGSFVDLSVLDVLQVFGRAGRPGLESSGEGYICTTEDKLTHYLETVTSQNPIESQFARGMIDALNAEISLGTVANLHDAVQWLGYTYLFVRMRKNPFFYGIPRETLLDDPQLGGKRQEFIRSAANRLANAQMIVLSHASGGYTITDLGRIAAKYYLRHASVEIFNKEFRPRMTEADILAMLSMSTEFDQIQLRESETKELEILMERAPCDVKGGVDTSQGKVNILLQAYISREAIDDFALVSDMAYVAQNAGRIIRALVEIALSRKWAAVTLVLLRMSKGIESRLWPFIHPLRQFDLKPETLYNLEQWADEWTVQELLALDAKSLGDLVHLNEHQGQAILRAAKQFPCLHLEYQLRPLGPDILCISILARPSFVHDVKVHGHAEPFWLWVEDHEGLNILQLSHLTVRSNTRSTKVEFVITIFNGIPPPFFMVRVISHRWIGAEDEIQIPLDSLIMPLSSQTHTPLLTLPLLPISITKNPVSENLHGFTHFNAIQTQAYWTFMCTRRSSLLCAPGGNGKSTLARLTALLSTHQAENFWTLMIIPHHSSASAMYADIRAACQLAGISVEQSRSSNVLARPKGKVLRIATADTLLAALTPLDPHKTVEGLDLVICDDLEQLNQDYEWAVSLLKHASQARPTRFVGFSTSLNDAADLADWLNVHPLALFSFRPRDRDLDLNFFVQTFTIPHSASLLKAMAKPAHAAIRTVPEEGAIIFVPSRGQSRGIALNLLTQCMLEMESTRGYLPDDASNEYIEDVCARLQDTSLGDFVGKGIGFFHSGVLKKDRLLMLSLFAEGITRVLIVPHDSCFSLPVRAAIVVVMGTQYVDSSNMDASNSGDYQIRDYTLAELARMQGRAARHVGSGHFFLFCQAEAKDTLTKFLNDGLPLESSLLQGPTLIDWMKAQKIDWKDRRQDLMDALSFSYLGRRIVSNPSYYGCSSRNRNENLSCIVDQLIREVYADGKEAVSDIA